MLQDSLLYQQIKAGTEGQPFVLPFLYETTIPVTDATLEHVVALEIERYQRQWAETRSSSNRDLGVDLDAKVRAQTRTYLGGTLWRLSVVFVTAENVDAVVATTEANPTFKKWCAE